jgi:type I site-specific restriction-modification system R (restriction) subunit
MEGLINPEEFGIKRTRESQELSEYSDSDDSNDDEDPILAKLDSKYRRAIREQKRKHLELKDHHHHKKSSKSKKSARLIDSFTGSQEEAEKLRKDLNKIKSTDGAYQNKQYQVLFNQLANEARTLITNSVSELQQQVLQQTQEIKDQAQNLASDNHPLLTAIFQRQRSNPYMAGSYQDPQKEECTTILMEACLPMEYALVVERTMVIV